MRPGRGARDIPGAAPASATVRAEACVQPYYCCKRRGQRIEAKDGN